MFGDPSHLSELEVSCYFIHMNNEATHTVKIIHAIIDGLRCDTCSAIVGKYAFRSDRQMLCFLCEYKADKAAREATIRARHMSEAG